MSAKINLEVTPDQTQHLENLLEFSKAFASPLRLAIIGALAIPSRGKISLEELADETNLSFTSLEKEIQQLQKAGLILKESDDFVSLSPTYHQIMPQAIGALAKLATQWRIPQPKIEQDERAKTIYTFFKDGKLTGWPAQYSRQVYLLEEIVKIFEPGLRYSEKQVDQILQNLGGTDHCTLRRALIDLQLLQRDNNIYWKNTGQPTPI